MTASGDYRDCTAAARDARDALLALQREAARLAAVDVDDLTRVQLDDLATMSEPLVALASAWQRTTPDSPAYDDARLVAWLAERARADARPRARSRDRSGLGDSAWRDALRSRILTDSHAARLRVLLADAPRSHALPLPRRVDRELLRDLERSRRAVLLPDVRVAAGGGRELLDQESDVVIDVPDNLPAGAYLALAVAGDSMQPLLADGDGVLVRLDSTARPGTVVVARDPEHGYVVKELAAVDEAGMELRSLNAAYEPRRIAHAPGAVLGTVLMRWKVGLSQDLSAR